MRNHPKFLALRTDEVRFTLVDPEPIEASVARPQKLSMRQEIAQYLANLEQPLSPDEETALLREQLTDFMEEDPEDRVLSDYQLEAMAAELADLDELEKEEVLRERGSQPPDLDPEGNPKEFPGQKDRAQASESE